MSLEFSASWRPVLLTSQEVRTPGGPELNQGALRGKADFQSGVHWNRHTLNQKLVSWVACLGVIRLTRANEKDVMSKPLEPLYNPSQSQRHTVYIWWIGFGNNGDPHLPMNRRK